MSENKTITITNEQFREAVIKANTKWEVISRESGDTNPVEIFMRGLHNVTFGATIASVLFDESEDKE